MHQELRSLAKRRVQGLSRSLLRQSYLEAGRAELQLAAGGRP
jgi:hypothetical protein